jgi:hypothetical protein
MAAAAQGSLALLTDPIAQETVTQDRYGIAAEKVTDAR